MRNPPAAWRAGPLLRKSAVALVLLLIAALHVLAALRLPVGVFNDDAANVLLARSLGRGSYSFPGGLGAPEEFMPAFPLLLAVPARLVEPHWNLLRAIPLAFLALCLLLTWRLARRLLSVEAAAAVVLLTALSPVLAGFGGLVVPYLPYLALSLALIDGAGAEGGRRDFLLLAGGAALAPLVRPQGAVLIGCLALAQWHRGGLKRGAAFLSLALLPALAWTARNHLRAGSSLDYVDTWRAHIAAVGSASLFDRVSLLLSSLFGATFLALPGAVPAPSVFGALVLGLALYGAFRLLREREDPRAFVLASYVAGLVFLHMTWKWIDPRYLIPFVPLLWILVVAAAARLLGDRPAVKGALLAVLTALALAVVLPLARLGLRGSAQFQPKTMAWIRENVPPSARLVSVKNYSVALLTGRECTAQPMVPHAGAFLKGARLFHIDYIHLVLPRPQDEFVSADLPAAYQPAFARWLDGRADVTHVYHDLDEGAVVYRIDAPAPQPGMSAAARPAGREKL